jgi:hypothetical protein
MQFVTLYVIVQSTEGVDAVIPTSANSDKGKHEVHRRAAHAGRIKPSHTPASIRQKNEQYAKNITKRGLAGFDVSVLF